MTDVNFSSSQHGIVVHFNHPSRVYVMYRNQVIITRYIGGSPTLFEYVELHDSLDFNIKTASKSPFLPPFQVELLERKIVMEAFYKQALVAGKQLCGFQSTDPIFQLFIRDKKFKISEELIGGQIVEVKCVISFHNEKVRTEIVALKDVICKDYYLILLRNPYQIFRIRSRKRGKDFWCTFPANFSPLPGRTAEVHHTLDFQGNPMKVIFCCDANSSDKRLDCTVATNGDLCVTLRSCTAIGSKVKTEIGDFDLTHRMQDIEHLLMQDQFEIETKAHFIQKTLKWVFEVRPLDCNFNYSFSQSSSENIYTLRCPGSFVDPAVDEHTPLFPDYVRPTKNVHKRIKRKIVVDSTFGGGDSTMSHVVGKNKGPAKSVVDEAVSTTLFPDYSGPKRNVSPRRKSNLSTKHPRRLSTLNRSFHGYESRSIGKGARSITPRAHSRLSEASLEYRRPIRSYIIRSNCDPRPTTTSMPAENKNSSKHHTTERNRIFKTLPPFESLVRIRRITSPAEFSLLRGFLEEKKKIPSEYSPYSPHIWHPMKIFPHCPYSKRSHTISDCAEISSRMFPNKEKDLSMINTFDIISLDPKEDVSTKFFDEKIIPQQKMEELNDYGKEIEDNYWEYQSKIKIGIDDKEMEIDDNDWDLDEPKSFIEPCDLEFVVDTFSIELKSDDVVDDKTKSVINITDLVICNLGSVSVFISDVEVNGATMSDQVFIQAVQNLHDITTESIISTKRNLSECHEVKTHISKSQYDIMARMAELLLSLLIDNAVLLRDYSTSWFEELNKRRHDLIFNKRKHAALEILEILNTMEKNEAFNAELSKVDRVAYRYFVQITAPWTALVLMQ